MGGGRRRGRQVRSPIPAPILPPGVPVDVVSVRVGLRHCRVGVRRRHRLTDRSIERTKEALSNDSDSGDCGDRWGDGDHQSWEVKGRYEGRETSWTGEVVRGGLRGSTSRFRADGDETEPHTVAAVRPVLVGLRENSQGAGSDGSDGPPFSYPHCTAAGWGWKEEEELGVESSEGLRGDHLLTPLPPDHACPVASKTFGWPLPALVGGDTSPPLTSNHHFALHLLSTFRPPYHGRSSSSSASHRTPSLS